jgi:threonyl-tRNA synthetase
LRPVVEDGFYYDFAYEHSFTPADLETIQAKMEELAAQDLPVTRVVKRREDAMAFFRQLGEEYKAQIIESIPAGEEFLFINKAILLIYVAGLMSLVLVN